MTTNRDTEIASIDRTDLTIGEINLGGGLRRECRQRESLKRSGNRIDLHDRRRRARSRKDDRARGLGISRCRAEFRDLLDKLDRGEPLSI